METLKDLPTADEFGRNTGDVKRRELLALAQKWIKRLENATDNDKTFCLGCGSAVRKNCKHDRALCYLYNHYDSAQDRESWCAAMMLRAFFNLDKEEKV